MPKMFQRLLLALGVLALITLIIELGLSVAATQHGSTPERVVHVDAGPYPLTLSLYTYPARAGFALPFAIAPQHPVSGLTYDVTSLPAEGVSATPVHASVSPDPNVQGGAQGTAEISVQGDWNLYITVNGPSGQGTIVVPVVATAPPAIPASLGWLIGCIPLYGLVIFLFLQRGR